MSSVDPNILFNDITRFIEQSRALVAAGKHTELAGLDDHIRGMCEQVMTLDEKEREQYADRLQFLFDELTALNDLLIHERDKIAQQASELGAHQKANNAYRTTDASDQTKDDE